MRFYNLDDTLCKYTVLLCQYPYCESFTYTHIYQDRSRGVNWMDYNHHLALFRMASFSSRMYGTLSVHSWVIGEWCSYASRFFRCIRANRYYSIEKINAVASITPHYNSIR